MNPRRIRARAGIRLLAAGSILTAVGGCDLWDRIVPDDSPSPAGELLAAQEAGMISEAPPAEGTGAVAAGSAGLPDFLEVGASPRDSAGPVDGGAPPGESTDPTLAAQAGDEAPGGDQAPAGGQTPEDLQARVARLEAVNDSLRATVLGLIALQSRLPEPGRTEEAADTAGGGSPEAILGAGANRARNWGLRIFFSLVFLALAWLVIRFVGWVLDRLAERSAQRRLFYKRLAPISRILLWVLAATFTTLVILDVDAGGLVAAGAAGGVALGFASQDILKNVFGGLIVLFDQPFQVGDKISVAGSYGEVVSIGLRSTRIVTPDDNLVTVPNAQVVDGQVANANAGELNCQVVTDLWLPGWVDEARAKEIAFQAATSSKYVFHNKPVVVLVKDEFDQVPLTHLKVKAYVLDPRYEFLFASDVTERARASFRDAGLLPRERGFEAGSVDFYDFLAQGRWGARLPVGGQGNGGFAGTGHEGPGPGDSSPGPDGPDPATGAPGAGT